MNSENVEMPPQNNAYEGAYNRRVLLFPFSLTWNLSSSSFSTMVIGNPSCRFPDGSPPTTCGDDRREWSFPTVVIGNPFEAVSERSLPQTRRDDRRGRGLHLCQQLQGQAQPLAGMTATRWLPPSSSNNRRGRL
jgi:hypothetical protein